MAVPKKKTSKSRRNKRRSHDKLAKVNVVINKTTGEYQLPHQVSLDGYYKEKLVIDKSKKDKNAESEEVSSAENKEITKEVKEKKETKA
jgi:large subunit ribosomal protein L32